MTETTVRQAAPAARAPAPAVLDWLLFAALAAVALAMVRAIAYTPAEAMQGLAQKIFYVHLPSALMAFVAFGVTALASAMYLWLRDDRLDRIAESSAEVGVVFTTGVLVTGPLWGKPIWGTWWTWDARLTLTLFMWFVYVGYLVLRGAIDERGMRARYSAIVGMLGALLIPFIHLSVYLFRTLHPRPIVLKPSAPSLPPEMLTTLLLSFGAFTLLYLALLRARYRLAVLQEMAAASEEG